MESIYDDYLAFFSAPFYVLVTVFSHINLIKQSFAYAWNIDIILQQR